MKNSTITATLFFAASILFLNLYFSSCKKDTNASAGNFDVPTDLTTKVSSSVSGFITYDDDNPVNGATVTVAGNSTVSNKYGYFELKNIQVVKDAAFVTVTRAGYFKGVKTYLATEGKTAFFRIKLIPKTIVGNINASAGGNVTLANGLKISLPANAVMNAATKAAYTGQVTVAAKWIDPTSGDLNLVMPGDLRGVDTVGSMNLLTTYGMAAVELTGSGGELLQVTTGKKATLTIPLPSAIAATAPNSIPLWYFDETVGLWKQEGIAVKTGNSYVGDVSHFSYWNCDVPSKYVRFYCSIMEANGKPVKNAYVKISIVGSPLKAGYGYTDSAGYTGGAIPNSANLLLEVFGAYNCSTVLYSKNFSTTNVNLSLGSITIPAANTATISGSVTNCSSAAVTNGYIIMKKDGAYSYSSLSNTGTFNFTTTLCGASTTATFIAEDIAALKASNTTTATITTGVNAIGSFNACSIATQQYMNYSINGTSYTLTSPADSLLQYGNQQTTPASISIYSYSVAGGTSNFKSTNIAFTQTGIAVGSSQNLLSFITRQLSDSVRIVAPIPVTITEYGAVGQFIAGDFRGTLTGASPANIPYAVTCNFRVRRSQ